MRINKFKPNSVFSSRKIQSQDFSRYLGGRTIHSFANGKSAIIAALKLWGIYKENILIPYYVCKDVEEAVVCSGNNVVYCDIDISDLNISYDSIVEICTKCDIKVVLVPSLYGNPARIDDIERFCRKRHIYLLNDCAQSIGSFVNEKHIASYGDAAITSLSPGKPLPGFSGGYLSINADIKDYYTSTHHLYYICACSTYLFSRLWIDSIISRIIGRIISFVCYKFITYDLIDISKFRLPIWVHNYNMKFFYYLYNGKFEYRSIFISQFQKSKYYRVISSSRGFGVPYVLVMVFNTSNLASEFKEYILEKKIYYSSGYSINTLCFDSSKYLVDKLINLPIDPDFRKRDYLFKSIADWTPKKNNKET